MNICQKLREAGYTSYGLQKDGILSTTMWTRLVHRKSISWRTLDKICALLEMQPGEIIGYKHENKVCTILQVQPGELFGYREDEEE